MHVVHVRGIVPFVADAVLPEAALPDAALILAHPGRQAPFGARQDGRERGFQRVPSAGIIVIVRR